MFGVVQLYQGRRETAEDIFREEVDNVAYLDHETRVFHDVVLGGPAQLRKFLEALKAERTRSDTCSVDRDGGVRGVELHNIIIPMAMVSSCH